MMSDAEELNVNLDALHEMKTKKSEIKKLLKMRIGGIMRREAEKKIATMKKLRFLKGSEFGKKEYMKHCDAEEIARILNVKLNMCTIGANFVKPESCRVCKQELETTEHLFECEAVGRMIWKYKGKSITRCRARDETMEMVMYCEPAMKECERISTVESV